MATVCLNNQEFVRGTQDSPKRCVKVFLQKKEFCTYAFGQYDSFGCVFSDTMQPTTSILANAKKPLVFISWLQLHDIALFDGEFPKLRMNSFDVLSAKYSKQSDPQILQFPTSPASHRLRVGCGTCSGV